MSTSSDDSDFEEIGFSECESASGNCSLKREESASTPVIVQLPSDFLQEKESINASTTSSLASFFCPQMGGMQIQPPPSNSKIHRRSSSSASVDSSWASCTTQYHGDFHTVASCKSSSSVISGFDILSINGSTHRRCHRCTFLNGENAFICHSCDAALSANPCLDIDLQIALNLQQKEESEAFQKLHELEYKRKLMSTLDPWQQAESLAADIVESVAGMKNDVGISTFSQLDLTMHASRFIEHRRRFASGGDIRLVYHFSTELSSGTWDSIRVNGFRGPGIKVSTDMTIAYLQGKRPRGNFTSVLPSIDESRSLDKTIKLGWIVAVVGPSATEEGFLGRRLPEDHPFGIDGPSAHEQHGRRIPEEPEIDLLERIGTTDAMLPLVSFDASIMQKHGKYMQYRLENVLGCVCRDFFWFLDDTPPPSKRLKSDPGYYHEMDQHLPAEAGSSHVIAATSFGDTSNVDDLGMRVQRLFQECHSEKIPSSTTETESDNVWASFAQNFSSDAANQGEGFEPLPLAEKVPVEEESSVDASPSDELNLFVLPLPNGEEDFKIGEYQTEIVKPDDGVTVSLLSEPSTPGKVTKDDNFAIPDTSEEEGVIDGDRESVDNPNRDIDVSVLKKCTLDKGSHDGAVIVPVTYRKQGADIDETDDAVKEEENYREAVSRHEQGDDDNQSLQSWDKI